jgi:23S rRNA pseudouridine1911/1915/1917 synthase
MSAPSSPFASTISAAEAGQRLDRFLAGLCPDFSRSRLQDFIRDGHARVNGAPSKPSYPLREGDAVGLDIPIETTPSPLPAEEMPLGILFEDAHLLVLDKPAGLVVHPGAGNREGTLANGLLHHCAGIEVVGGTERPGIVHRLDKETSGCLVVAKTESAHRLLADQFASRGVEKTYLALVDGTPRMPHGTIEAAIGRHPVHRQKMAVVERGRDALTRYRVLESREGKALVQCQPKTGRTHQIRVHLKHLGHPVSGDPAYGRRGSFERHMLHAWKLEFTHPATGERVSFTAPLPLDFPAWAREASRSEAPNPAIPFKQPQARRQS